jgi:hypothetical protein
MIAGTRHQNSGKPIDDDDRLKDLLSAISTSCDESSPCGREKRGEFLEGGK